jgi:hypothetical protein
MTDRPILFKSEMVRAILEGRKTQTRRIMKPQPVWHRNFWMYDGEPFLSDDTMQSHLLHNVYGVKGSPYGAVYADDSADHLWVRETWADVRGMGFDEFPMGVSYRADCANASLDVAKSYGVKWKPSIFMPRWASRITLEITDVRVERLQDITETDAIAEGIEAEKLSGFSGYWKNYEFTTSHPRRGEEITDEKHRTVGYKNPIASYASLWRSINGAESWDANPWVWVVEFKHLHDAQAQAGTR